MKVKYVVAILMILSLIGCSGGYSDADLKKAASDAIAEYRKCALAFHEGYQDVDTSGDYHKAYGQAVELINQRVACENAVTKSLN